MLLTTQAVYSMIYDAAKEGKAKEYFEEVYMRMVPNAQMENTQQFMEYIDERKEMYLHYHWEPELAETNAVIDGIEALVNEIANRRAYRINSN